MSDRSGRLGASEESMRVVAFASVIALTAFSAPPSRPYRPLVRKSLGSTGQSDPVGDFRNFRLRVNQSTADQSHACENPHTG
jgi:hypothetical protein